MTTSTGNVVGVRSGSDDPTVIAPFRQLVRIVFTHIIGGVLLRDGQIGLKKRSVGLETLGEVRAHCAPVIHLHIDVVPKPSGPRRVKILTPSSLQVGR